MIVHCGAQSTRDTAMLAEQAVADGAAGVAVIAPPYFAPDDRALEEHFLVAARASAPAPFYVYEFAARSGYAVPIVVIEKLRERAPNLAGLKVSDIPFEHVEPYLLDGLDVFIGAEELIHRGLASGAAGAVSGLAAALPEVTVRAVRTAPPRTAPRPAASARQSSASRSTPPSSTSCAGAGWRSDRRCAPRCDPLTLPRRKPWRHCSPTRRETGLRAPLSRPSADLRTGPGAAASVEGAAALIADQLGRRLAGGQRAHDAVTAEAGALNEPRRR